MGTLEDEDLAGPYSSPLLYPLPDSSSWEEGSGTVWLGVGELPELDEEATLCMAELVLGMAEVDEFLSLCLGRTALNKKEYTCQISMQQNKD
jgi:hypothetical protein